VIELDQVWRSYQVGEQPLHALQDVSVVVPDGGYVAIMGPSGSGKSTLLNILGCLDRPSQGVYRLDGEDVGSLPEEEISEIRRHKIGFIFQSFHLVARLSAAENVALPMLLAGTSPEERAERVASALEAVGMSERAGHRPNELSGGERQRVAIARATVMRPKVLLADEPTGNLDSASGSQVMELLEGMNASGLTLVVVTHDPGIGQRADRVLLLRDGRVDREIAGSELGGSLGILAGATSS
jgi:putative ABC transport system ATP-binding protein